MWLRNITSEPVMFLHAFATMINMSILPQLVLRKICLRHEDGGTNEKCTGEVAIEISNVSERQNIISNQ